MLRQSLVYLKKPCPRRRGNVHIFLQKKLETSQAGESQPESPADPPHTSMYPGSVCTPAAVCPGTLGICLPAPGAMAAVCGRRVLSMCALFCSSAASPPWVFLTWLYGAQITSSSAQDGANEVRRTCVGISQAQRETPFVVWAHLAGESLM